MSKDSLKIIKDNASFITVAIPMNVRILNLITFKDYWQDLREAEPDFCALFSEGC